MPKGLDDAWQAYQERKQRIEELTRRFEDLKKSVDELREEIRSEIRQVSLDDSNKLHNRYIAVDSAYTMIPHTFAVEYLAVAVAAMDTREFHSSILYEFPEFETLAQVEIEETMSRRILEGMGSALELLLADRYRGVFPVIYLDGSFDTFVIKLNSLLSLTSSATESSNPFFSRLSDLAKRATEAFHNLLKQRSIIAVPKISFRNEFIHNYGLEKREEFKGIQGDYPILHLLLKEGEYVEVPTRSKAHALSGVDDGKKKEIFGAIGSASVVYLKGLSGKVYKFEVVGTMVPETIYPLTPGYELLPLFEADRLAKDHLGMLLEGGQVSFLEGYREGR